MPTFIDESGDTGPDPNPLNRHFRLAAVWVPSPVVAESIRNSVRLVRRQLNLRNDYEFKFSKTWHYPERRRAFFEAAMQLEFRFTASSIDKTVGEWPNAGRHVYHWASSVALAASLRPTYLQALAEQQIHGATTHLNDLVVVDDNQDAEYLEMIRETFRGLGSACEPRLYLIGKVRFGGSKPDELIQLADMICGAVASRLDGDSTWYDMIAPRSLGISLI